MDGEALAGVFHKTVGIVGFIQFADPVVDKRQVEIALFVPDMDRRWGSIDQLAEAGYRAIRRNKVGEDRHQVHDQQQPEGDRCQSVFLELDQHELVLRCFQEVLGHFLPFRAGAAEAIEHLLGPAVDITA